MNKNTIILFVAVAVLAIATLLATQKEEVAAPKKIEVPGYAPKADLDKRAKQGIMDTPVNIDYPIDEVIYTFKDTTVRMVRDGTGKDTTWLIKEPVDAVAVKYQVEKMIKLFETATSSIQPKTIKPKDFVRFDLEPESRVAFTLKQGGNVWNGVDFVVGKVSQGEGGPPPGGGQKQSANSDTWVLKKGDDTTVYRIAGKDLRAPFEVSLSDLRDKKVLTAKATDLVKLAIQAPGGAPKVVLTGDRKEEPKKKDAKPDAKPTFKVTWTLTEPAGVKGDKSIDSMARSLANLRTREFVPADKGPEGGLGAEVWALTGTTHEGKSYTVHIAAKDGVGEEDDKVWAQVAGKKEFLKLDKYGAKNLRKSLADLKDKALFGYLKAEDITMLQTAPPGGGKVRIEKGDEGWAFVAPTQDPKKGPVWTADPASVLRTIATARLSRFAAAGEVPSANGALEKPEFVAQLSAKGKTYLIKVGPKMEEGDTKNQRWARMYDNPDPAAAAPVPFLIQDFTASRFRKTAADLRRKTLFSFDAKDVAKLTVTWPDGATKVDLQRAADGKLAAVGLPPGKKTKASTVTTMSTTLAKLRVKSFPEGKKLAELGLDKKSAYVVTATLADGKAIEVLISAKTDGTDPYATTNFGPLAGQLFTLNKYQVDNLQKEPKDLAE